MTQFDYQAAWRDLATPEFEALPANVRSLLQYTIEHAPIVEQDRDTLDTQWPADPAVRTRFEKTPTEWLAQGARAIYFYGHWAPMGHESHKYGAYWKCSGFCDQVLRARLQLPRIGPKHGIGFACREGTLIASFSARDVWMQNEIGFATEQALAKAIRVTLPADEREYLDRYVPKLIAACETPSFARWRQ